MLLVQFVSFGYLRATALIGYAQLFRVPIGKLIAEETHALPYRKPFLAVLRADFIAEL